MRIHPVFHVSLISKYHANTIAGREFEEPPPEVIDDEEEWEVELIKDSRYKRRKLQYLVHWTGYSDDHDSWVDSGEMEHAEELVRDFHNRYPEAASPTHRPPASRSGRKRS